jgi:hypothetical protein
MQPANESLLASGSGVLSLKFEVLSKQLKRLNVRTSDVRFERATKQLLLTFNVSTFQRIAFLFPPYPGDAGCNTETRQ